MSPTNLLDAHPDTLLTPGEASVLLGGVSEKTLAKMRCEGRGPTYVKIARRVRYRVQDLRTYIEQMRRVSTSDPGRAHGPLPASMAR